MRGKQIVSFAQLKTEKHAKWRNRMTMTEKNTGNEMVTRETMELITNYMEATESGVQTKLGEEMLLSFAERLMATKKPNAMLAAAIFLAHLNKELKPDEENELEKHFQFPIQMGNLLPIVQPFFGKFAGLYSARALEQRTKEIEMNNRRREQAVHGKRFAQA